MKTILPTLALLTLLSGCRTIREVPVKTETRIVERLVPVELPADSAWLTALFECDSSYNVLLKSVTEEKSKGMESNLTYTQGELRYKVIRTIDTIYVPVRDSTTYREVPVTVEVPKAYIPRWVLWIATIAVGIVVITIARLFAKFKS